MRRRLALSLLLLLLATLGLLRPGPAAAHANLARSEPVARSATPVPPTEIRLFFTEPPELRYTEIKVYDANLGRYEQGAVATIPGDPLGATIAVANLADGGIYSVVWKTVSSADGHATEGSFAFAVGNAPPPASVGLGSDVSFKTPGPVEVFAKWLTILAATALVGALGLRLLVWRPILRDSDLPADGDFARRLSRRLVRLAGGALLLLLAATVLALLLQAAKVGNRAVTALDATLLSEFLLNTRTGAIWLTRLLVPLVALMLLAPLLLAALRREGTASAAAADTEGDAARTLAPTGPLAFGVALGAAYLLTISLISHSAAVPFWGAFTIALDWLHLLAVSLWVGGLLGLVLTAPLVGGLGVATRPVLARLVARFSTLGVASVAILGVTGLYSSWLHVGSLDALFGTDYGRYLTGKLALFAGLVALGALNKFWIAPRLATPIDERRKPSPRRGEGERGSRVAALMLRYFGRIVRIEALLGVAILAIVAVYTGLLPAREAIVQARQPKRYQTISAADLKLTMTLGALQPGDNSFDLYLEEARGGRPVADAEKVAFRLTEVGMDMGETEVVATSRGDGHYVASGPYLSMSGTWNLRAIVRRTAVPDVDLTFRFPIGSAANVQSGQGQLTAPTLPRLTSPRGLGFVSLAVGLALAYVGVRLFRRGSGWGTAMLMLVPTALVVGGYLVYNGAEEPQPGGVVAFEPPNPVAADAASIASGQALFAQNCVICHGPQGRGDGPQAPTLNPRPPDMTQQHTAFHSDGYLYNAITNGLPGSAMPAWGDTFTTRQKWDLVNYLRQFNPLTASGAAPTPVTTLPTPTPSASPRPAGTPAAAGAATPAAPVAGSAAPGGPGRLIHAFDGTLWAIDPQTGQGRNLTPNLGSDAYAGDPALAPDGATIAFTVVVVPAPNPSAPPTQRSLPGSDLWLMDADGNNRRQIFAHDRPGLLIEMPIFTPDGKALVYTYSAPILAPDGRYTGTLRELQRLDLATGQRTTLVKDAEDAAFAPAGGATPFAYIATDPQTFAQTLRVANLDGGGSRQIVGPEAKFQTINSPRFTPDGARIVFAAAGQGLGGEAPPPAPSGNVAARFLRWLVEPLVPQSVAAHGPPADLWSVATDGSDLRRLTNLNGDDPQPAFSPDGKQLAFLTGNGLFLANVDGTGARKISERGGTSTLVWSPR